MSFDFGPEIPKMEPNADVRRFAATLREFYTAQIDVGFAPGEALTLTVTFMQNMLER